MNQTFIMLWFRGKPQIDLVNEDYRKEFICGGVFPVINKHFKTNYSTNELMPICSKWYNKQVKRK